MIFYGQNNSVDFWETIESYDIIIRIWSQQNEHMNIYEWWRFNHCPGSLRFQQFETSSLKPLDDYLANLHQIESYDQDGKKSLEPKH